MKSDQIVEEESPSVENMQMSPDHKKKLTLLAHMLLRARVEKEMREREQLALYGGLAGADGEQVGLKDVIPPGPIGKFERLLRFLIVYPDDTFRAQWDLIMTL